MHKAAQLNLLVLSSGALFMVAVVDCGGRASADPQTTTPGQTGGYLGVGGGTSTGGSAGGNPSTNSSTLMGTRVPAIHRPQASSCVGVHSPPEPNITDSQYSSCLRHADCTDGVNGKCVRGMGMASQSGFCRYDMCATDADCEPGKVCYCTPTDAARCLSVGDCQVDSACGANGFCSPSMGSDCGGNHSVDSFYCHTPADTCLDDSDCTGSDYCDYNIYSGHWGCAAINNNCIIG